MKTLVLAAYVDRSKEPIYVNYNSDLTFSVTKDLTEVLTIPTFDHGIALLADLKMKRSADMREIIGEPEATGSIVFFLYEFARWDSTKPVISNVMAQRLYRF